MELDSWCPVTGQEAVQKNPFKCQNSFTGGSQTLDQVAQRGSGDVQNPASHGPEQPAPADPALSRDLGLGNLQRCLPTSAVP